MASSTTGQTNVTTGAAQAVITGDQNSPSGAIVRNRGTVAVYWGYVSTIDATTGFQLDAGETDEIPLDSGEVIYMTASSGTQAVHWARSRALARQS